MAKTLSQFMIEVAQPKSEDEKAFKDKHVVQTTDDANGNGDDVFKAEKIKKDKTKPAGYHDGEDVEAYESMEVDILRAILESEDADVEYYVESYKELSSVLNEDNLQKLDEMIRQGEADKVMYFLEAVRY